MALKDDAVWLDAIMPPVEARAVLIGPKRKNSPMKRWVEIGNSCPKHDGPCHEGQVAKARMGFPKPEITELLKQVKIVQ